MAKWINDLWSVADGSGWRWLVLAGADDDDADDADDADDGEVSCFVIMRSIRFVFL